MPVSDIGDWWNGPKCKIRISALLFFENRKQNVPRFTLYIMCMYTTVQKCGVSEFKRYIFFLLGLSVDYIFLI